MGSMVGSLGGMIGGMVGGLIQGYYADKQSKVMEDYYKSQQEYAQQQAKEEVERSQRLAFAQEQQAIEDARRKRQEDMLRLEEHRAMGAGSGLSLSVGSPLLIEEQNDITSRLNALDIFKAGMAQGEETRYQGKQNERGLLWQAEQFRWQADQEKSKRKMNKVMTVMNMFMGGLTGGSKLYNDYQNSQAQSVKPMTTQQVQRVQTNQRPFTFTSGSSGWDNSQSGTGWSSSGGMYGW